MRFFLLFFIGLLVGLSGVAQQAAPPASAPEADLVLGKTAFPVNEYFTISFRLRGAPLERYSAFPDIEGFKRSGKSSTTTTRIVAGQTSTELTITQRYAAYAEGEYVLKPFTMTVNGLTIRSEGATLKVGPEGVATAPAPPAGSGPLQGIGSLDQLFGKQKPQEYLEPHDDAFLAVQADRPRVYVGQGLHVALYFYLTPQDQAVLNFHNFAGQLPGIIRQLRQRTVWEESFDDQEVTPENVTVGGKPFLRYRLWQAELYPLNTQPLVFPAVELRMLKYRLAKKSDPDLDNRLEGYKTYRSQARTVPVLPLPRHPLRDQVPVGSYQLREAIDRTTFRTGRAFAYTFVVEGEGNLAALNLPAPVPPRYLELYGPEVEQRLTRQAGRVGGRKSFRFRLVARRPGAVPLDSLFQLVVFNPATARYDTLRSSLHPIVRGPARAETALRARSTDPFYREALARADATPQPINVYQSVRRYANLLLLALLVVAGIGWWRGQR
ncbi:BatD family protein [Hymenobacter weizhouensis]|uniref:BatD family protein n=1 Tax=Hymenobacter sp. YIM 151500-1 TaxID=2987689 RepID=UPI002225E7C8|nr:BatD family protein [Hymenobacter sp. YIM 151500-1]UYZ63025.1 BatD family protein [Hymenobacter sp. YIM 151500-1]